MKGSTWISIKFASHSVHCGIHAYIINLFNAFSSLTLVILSVRAQSSYGMGDSVSVFAAIVIASFFFLRILQRCWNSKHILIEWWLNPSYVAFAILIFYIFLLFGFFFMRIVHFFAYNWRFQLMAKFWYKILYNKTYSIVCVSTITQFFFYSFIPKKNLRVFFLLFPLCFVWNAHFKWSILFEWVH